MTSTSHPSIQPLSLFVRLANACEAARARGLELSPGNPCLAVRAGRYAASFGKRVDPLGALLIGVPTRAACYDLGTAFTDAAALLGVSKAWVHWMCDGVDDLEDPPTVEEGFAPEAIEAHAVGAALRARYFADDDEPLN
jgi:hypothetical protein